MPVNLNALIRYKTLDKCFKKLSTVVTIEYLIEECSEALYDATGNKSGVSERTIRNDIRVLRSSILDFNAPIVVKNGIYSYESKEFSLFEQKSTNLELLEDIQELLVEEFDNISNKNLPFLLQRLAKLTNTEVNSDYLPKPSDPHIFEKRIYSNYEKSLSIYLRKQNKKPSFWSKPVLPNLKWEFIFNAL